MNCQLTDFAGREVSGVLSWRVGVDLQRLRATARRVRSHLDGASTHVCRVQVQRRKLLHVHSITSTTAAVRRPIHPRHCDSQRPLLRETVDHTADESLLQQHVTTFTYTRTTLTATTVTQMKLKWTWWDWSLILWTYLPSVLWRCWLGHLTRKN